MAVLTSPSGRQYVVAKANYPSFIALPEAWLREIGDENTSFLTASLGNLIELHACHGDWGYGARLVNLGDAFETLGRSTISCSTGQTSTQGRPHASCCKAIVPGKRSREGVFRLDWVRGVRLRARHGGSWERVDFDVSNANELLAPPCGRGMASHFRAKLRRQEMDRADCIWPLLSYFLNHCKRSDGTSAETLKLEQESEFAHLMQQVADGLRSIRTSAADRFKSLRSGMRLSEQAVVAGSAPPGVSEEPSLAKVVLDRLASQDVGLDSSALHGFSSDHRSGGDLDVPCRGLLQAPPGLGGLCEEGNLCQLMGDEFGWDDGAEFALFATPEASTKPVRQARSEAPSFDGTKERVSPVIADSPPRDGRASSHVWSRMSAGERDISVATSHVAPRRRWAQSLINAKRSGELQDMARELATTRTDMVSSASDLQPLHAKFKALMLDAHRSGQLHKIAGDLAREVEQKADVFERLKKRALQGILRMKRAGELERLARDMSSEEPSNALSAKERALRSLLEMKRSGELERLAGEMGDTQEKLEQKAAQLRAIAERMRRGLRDARRSGDLQRIASEMTQVLETKADTIRGKIRRGLIRAHRTGELHELRGELDELADIVPTLEQVASSSKAGASSSTVSRDGPSKVTEGQKDEPRLRPFIAIGQKGRRWAEMSSDSDFDPRVGFGNVRSGSEQASVAARTGGVESQSDCSVSEGESNHANLLSSASHQKSLAHDHLEDGAFLVAAGGKSPLKAPVSCPEDDLSSLSSGDSATSGGNRRRTASRKNRNTYVRSRFARSLLKAKRSGELQALSEEFANTQTEAATSASDLKSLKEKSKAVMMGARSTGELFKVVSDLALEVEQRADEFHRMQERALQSITRMNRVDGLECLMGEVASDEPLSSVPTKERARRSLLKMKRSGELERLAGEMGDAHQELEAQAVHLRTVKSSGELERVAGALTQVLDRKALTIGGKLRRGLLRAHRAGELHELRGELDELADVVPDPETHNVASTSCVARTVRRRWSEMTSSDSDADTRQPCQPIADTGGGPGSLAYVSRKHIAHSRTAALPRDSEQSADSVCDSFSESDAQSCT
eukprot:TRINITY_DN34850_c0_g1_i1.p1 TRINITY_DN34850_c0_g1~~TRINITY_DN34850_c0_g1_i1.p1  ORF type:complete len:1085 (-),score=168.92 TRINITY_DN34850_c0_g1_i1:233-3487(-)